ncbi:PREDICTED: scm-like with four MBT domains protein 2 [Priapulus caudatus]|uniref:Scm-like with four MBT domains protein 2 n=1 Tax=Priapulus caudatus TaxID=37621 RepID=A0ABM1EUB5_PRICU|nr:PREDICTED: scm-like with four MBT domains protein 2 [Priapulus caudatus]
MIRLVLGCSYGAQAPLQQRRRRQQESHLVLETNPLEWSVDDVARFIANTECAHMSRILGEQEIDGQALMLLNLPTV